MRPPTIAEELLVLTSDPTTGGVPETSERRVNHGLVGALLVDLALSGHIGIDGDRVHLRSTAPTGDPNLDHLAEKISSERRPRKIRWWVERTKSKRLSKTLMEHAEAHGVLRSTSERSLGVTLLRYGPARPGHRRQLLLQLRGVLDSNGHADDPRTRALLVLDQMTYMPMARSEDHERGQIITTERSYYEIRNSRFLQREREDRRTVREMMRNDPIARAVNSTLEPSRPPAP